jgi:hypothetical protein
MLVSSSVSIGPYVRVRLAETRLDRFRGHAKTNAAQHVAVAPYSTARPDEDPSFCSPCQSRNSEFREMFCSRVPQAHMQHLCHLSRRDIWPWPIVARKYAVQRSTLGDDLDGLPKARLDWT